MNMQETVDQYFSGWNAHDAKKVASLFHARAPREYPVSGMAVRPFDIKTIMIEPTGKAANLRGVDGI